MQRADGLTIDSLSDEGVRTLTSDELCEERGRCAHGDVATTVHEQTCSLVLDDVSAVTNVDEAPERHILVDDIIVSV